MYTTALKSPHITCWNMEAIRTNAYQPLIIVTETCEELVIGVKQILTDEFEPLTSRSSPVQG